MKKFFVTSLVLISFSAGAWAHGGESESEGTAVGPEKGILEARESEGIRLSAEAFKNFGIETVKLKGPEPWVLPASAEFRGGEEVNVYRLRGAFFRRIDFVPVRRNKNEFSIRSPDLKAGDEVVISGVGFLRIAEIAAFGGTPDEH